MYDKLCFACVCKCQKVFFSTLRIRQMDNLKADLFVKKLDIFSLFMFSISRITII